jgi:uncharacterized protein
MITAQRPHRAVVISRFDLSGAQDLMVHGCEDCACAVSEAPVDQVPRPLPAGAIDTAIEWVIAREILSRPVDAGHTLLFNPLGHGGVTVVNDPAYRIFRHFQEPASILQALPAGEEAEAVFRQLAQLEMIHPAGLTQKPDFRAGEVLTAWLHVTNACNLRCPYCYVNKTAEGMDEATGLAAVDAVIRSAVEHGFPAVKLKYAGGEASLNHRLIARMHDHAQTLAAEHGLQLHATLLSNGVALPPSLIATLKAAGIRVMISLDGIGQQHDVQRPFANGRPSFALVDKTIGQLIEQGHRPHLSITITSRNVGGVADVVRFALERDLTFSLNFFRDNDCAATFSDLQYAEQAMISSLLDAFGVIEEYLPPWSVLGSILDRGQLVRPQQRACGVGEDYMVIDQRGRVAKCHMEIERTIGDVFSDDPLELVRQDRSSALNLVSDDKEGCRDCTWRYWCTGGCTVATFRATGRYDIKSPNCNIYKAIYPEALRLEALRLLKYVTPGARG